MRKLNLGCGFDKRDGFVNADNFAECEPDVHIDIEQTPWSLADNSFDYILMKHVLEHVGADFKTFACVMRELYRVTAPGGIIEIHVPHFRHDTWWSDPTPCACIHAADFPDDVERAKRRVDRQAGQLHHAGACDEGRF
jgi:predicted SAM-dependent methyltransferase